MNIGLVESTTIEFKESTALKKTAGSDLVAMANTVGGTCYFGVKDDGMIIGVTPSEKTIKHLFDYRGQTIDPKLSLVPTWETIGRYTVLKVTVEKSKTPIHTYDGIAYKRNGPISQKIDKSEYKQRLLQYDKPTYDFSQQVIDEATMEDIDPRAIVILREKLNNPRVNFHVPADDIQLLKDLHLIQDGKLTYASIIILGTNLATRKYIPFAEVSYGYRNSEGDAYNLDDFVGLGGYLLYADRLREKINSRNLRLNIPMGLGLDLNRMAFDEETIREGINNAIIHRDYYVSQAIFILQHPYRIAIESPGGLPEGVTLENMADESKPRNKLIADVLRFCNMVDEFGNGINKMITNQIRRGKNAPDYSGSLAHKVVLHIEGAIADMSFAQYMIALGEEKQLSLNDKQLTLLRKIKEGQKVPSIPLVQKLLHEGFIEKAGHNKYMLCRQYYDDHDQKIIYSSSKGISKTDLIVLLNKYLSDQPNGLSKSEILNIPTMSYGWTTIYNFLKQNSPEYFILEGKPRSKTSKRKLVRKFPI